MDTVEVTLPAGIALEGRWHRTALIRALSGRDEEFLRERCRALPPAARTTALLARCMERLGPLSPVPAEAVRALTVGDREALMLHLRRATIGDRIACVLRCPSPSCREKMDLDLEARDLLLPPYAHQQVVHECRVDDGARRYRVRFRLPNGADQEAVVGLVARDPEAAARWVLDHCLQEVVVEGADEAPADRIPAAVADALPRMMAALDPQAEMMLSARCPSCGVVFTALFDAADFVYRELAGGSETSEALYREVHLLALHYHWGESDIMAMTRGKRRLYLDLLSGALAGGSG